ncbi:MAG: aldolase/citrate lyase family protein [Dehalococcoidia bacterium]|nr:aldolase/citrate lyase family protein [Chloroflexota bacterium]MCZ6865773.1 aldolase/citrate lyase family protein [Chloroflexota bacterium]
MVRLNRVIDQLEKGEPAIGAWANNGNLDDLAFITDAGYDYVFIDNEHTGLDFPTLRLSLQALLNRKRILETGSLQAHPTPIVRVTPNSREQNQWALKHTLDLGVYGLVIPVLDSVEAAQAAVVACRYPQRRGAADMEPKGERGWHPHDVAVRYWGISVEEYTDKADLWPLDPEGEMLLIGIIETVKGAKNLPDILKNVKGIGAIMAGAGDLSVDMGLGGNATTDPEVQETIMETLRVCKEYGVPCATGVRNQEDVDRRLEQGFRILTDMPVKSSAVLQHGRRVTSG